MCTRPATRHAAVPLAPLSLTVPLGLVLDLEEAFRLLEALEDARLELRSSEIALGLQDELATVIRIVHRRLGFDDEGLS